jgi:hypothetical protein
MTGGGGGTTTWVVGEVATEVEDDEGLGGAEVVICSLVVGDKTSGVRGCNTVGSKTSLVMKVSDRVLTKLRGGKSIKIKVLRGIWFSGKIRKLMQGRYDSLNRLLRFSPEQLLGVI